MIDKNAAVDLQGVGFRVQRPKTRTRWFRSRSAQAEPLTILHDISLQLRPGEITALVGPSGSGKTSLVMLIAGMETATSGSVRVQGQLISAMDETQRAILRRDHIGIIFQSFHLLKTMTAMENVAVPLELSGHPHPYAAAREALDSVGLSDRTTHYPAQLSGGEQQRVALARAICAKPRIILADEPTGNLDRDNGDKILALLFALGAQHHCAILLVTHDPKIAAQCSRVITLEDGRLVTDHAQ